MKSHPHFEAHRKRAPQNVLRLQSELRRQKRRLIDLDQRKSCSDWVYLLEHAHAHNVPAADFEDWAAEMSLKDCKKAVRTTRKEDKKSRPASARGSNVVAAPESPVVLQANTLETGQVTIDVSIPSWGDPLRLMIPNSFDERIAAQLRASPREIAAALREIAALIAPADG